MVILAISALFVLLALLVCIFGCIIMDADRDDGEDWDE